MSRRIFSGVLATAAVSLTLLVALLVTVVASPDGPPPATLADTVVLKATGETAGETPPTLGLQLAAQSVPANPQDRSRDGVLEPMTSAKVLPPGCLAGDDTLPVRPGPCEITSYGADRPTVVIWGDSHAWQQIPGLQEQAERTRTNLVAFVMGACPPMDLRGTGYRGLCVQQNEQALAFIDNQRERQRGLKVVLGGFWELYRDYHARAQAGWVPDDDHDAFLVTRAEQFATGGARLFGTLGRMDVPTAAIAQVPWVSDTAPACAAGEQPYACTLPRTSAIPAERATSTWLRSQLSRITLSGYIDTSRFLCGPQTCRASLDGEPVYLDELHLNPAITIAFAPEYRDLFT